MSDHGTAAKYASFLLFSFSCYSAPIQPKPRTRTKCKPHLPNTDEHMKKKNLKIIFALSIFRVFYGPYSHRHTHTPVDCTRAPRFRQSLSLICDCNLYHSRFFLVIFSLSLSHPFRPHSHTLSLSLSLIFVVAYLLISMNRIVVAE